MAVNNFKKISEDMMPLLSRVSNRIRRDYFKWSYMRAACAVLETPPVRRGNRDFLLLSMVHHRDVVPYLVAVKSFTRHINPERIVVVCDPTINANDRRRLTQHIPHIELRSTDNFLQRGIPSGGTWERLAAICHYAKEHYVVQLDADTVTRAPMPEVLFAVTSRAGFVLGEVRDQQLMSLTQTSQRSHHPHVQAFSEKLIADVGLPSSSLYVRGCSGFTGFPPCEDMEERMLDFSKRMEKRVGSRWTEWGTEQVTSNYLVANARGTTVLPFPKYCTPDQTAGETVFVHFIGSMRFLNGRYAAASREAINTISHPGIVVPS